jgi:hypothetical protein
MGTVGTLEQQRVQREAVATVAETRYEDYQQYMRFGESTSEEVIDSTELTLEEKIENVRAYIYESSRFTPNQHEFINHELTNELTDLSERFTDLPVENTFEYAFVEGNLYSTMTDANGQSVLTPLRPVFENGLVQARQDAEHNVRRGFIAERARLELEELQIIEALAQGKHPDVQALIVISPHPEDELLDGLDNIGFNRDRKLTMVRIAVPTAEGVKITSMSLDQSDRQALRDCAAILGFELPEGATSEDILAQRLTMRESPPEGYGWTDVIRKTYDDSIFERSREETYAGIKGLRSLDDLKDKMKNAFDYMIEQPDVLLEYITNLMELREHVQGELEYAQTHEELLRKTAAQLIYRYRGQELTADEAYSVAVTEGLNLSGDCPVGALSIEEQLRILGYTQPKKVKGPCPFCKVVVEYDPCAAHIICPNVACQAEVRDGQVVSVGGVYGKDQHKTGPEVAERPAATPLPEPVKQAAPAAPPTLQPGSQRHLKDGSVVELHQITGIGTARRVWVDQDTGQELTAAPEPFAPAA